MRHQVPGWTFLDFLILLLQHDNDHENNHSKAPFPDLYTSIEHGCSTPNVTDTTTNSSNTTAINPGISGGLNSSEMALTVVLGIVLGVVALAIIVYTLRKRRQRMLPFTHQRLYCRDDTVDLFAPPDDTLVISGGLYDGTQRNPDGDVTMDHSFSGQPARLRLEFLNDGTERTPNQASTFATFPSQWS
ncbi:hypothetical protein AALO_G00139470 [Alosa alosa]|uniref:Uncharacterized protein n=1 Tax=Alosa alosa TaxID=278164 RepID=A0AAV6GLL6_9TELE|nr:hypothetical protein AALO_G00139470 [Alosa alosa]